MPPGVPLELRTLPTIHPQVSILYGYGTSTIVRLSLDPIAQPSGTMVRSVVVEWVTRPGGGTPQVLTREIGWTDVPKAITDECIKWQATKNAQTITEDAAIGVMALLIHDLENAVITSVLQIGSGGDYILAIQGSPPVQAESSGIHTDPHGYLSTARLKEKSAQVLKKCAAGFASVTAFSHSATQEVRCQIHFVTAGTQPSKKSRKRKQTVKRPRSRKKRK